MTLATLTSRGQVTIPKSVRDSLLLKSGDKVEFVITESREALIRPITMNIDDVFGRLHNRARGPVSVEKMDKGIRRKIRESFK
jgi:AbrB family looped-hinge helix DNA binding protein